MANETLKPCAHCGGEAELDTAQAYRALVSGALGSRAVVYCTRCSSEIGFCYEDAEGTPKEDVVAQMVDDWNRRSPSQADAPGRVGELTVPARDGIEAQRGLNDIFPGDPYPIADQLKRGLDALRARASRGGITSSEVFTLTDPLMDILARSALPRQGDAE